MRFRPELPPPPYTDNLLACVTPAPTVPARIREEHERTSDPMPDIDVDKPRTPRCSRCGGELRFSHREYAGRGLQAVIRRCGDCGHSLREAPRARVPNPGRAAGRRRPMVDEGAPSNPVIDGETARRLLQTGSED